jgi:oligopeptide/dipeptide ABC transporter ATP-binding protein
MNEPIRHNILLEVRGLRTRFYTYEGEFDAVNGINLDIRKNESVGLVGETGCGKSVTALSILRLIQDPPGKIVSGSIVFEGEDLMTKSLDELREIRGKKIAMIFQKPMSSLNPTFKIGTQMTDIISLHQKIGKKEAWVRAGDLLRSVKIAAPENVVNRYPHELSGGMRQRVIIAIALSSNPDLLIADEPTTALDATIQKQILALIGDLRKEFCFSMLYISHNLRTVYNICEHIYVMYAGNIVEFGNIESVFEHSSHPYFKALMNSLPRFGAKEDVLAEIPGTLHSPMDPPGGCRFHPRCALVLERCKIETPNLCEIGQDHWVACFRAMEVKGYE